MKLRYLTLVLENCEHISIDGKYVGEFYIEGIETKIQRIAANSIEPMMTAHTVAFELHKKADKDCISSFFINDDSAFSRLSRYSDITSINFKLEDTDDIREFTIYPAWNDDNYQANKFQVNWQAGTGNFYILISDKYQFSDLFDLDKLNKRSNCDYTFKAAGVTND